MDNEGLYQARRARRAVYYKRRWLAFVLIQLFGGLLFAFVFEVLLPLPILKNYTAQVIVVAVGVLMTAIMLAVGAFVPHEDDQDDTITAPVSIALGVSSTVGMLICISIWESDLPEDVATRLGIFVLLMFVFSSLFLALWWGARRQRDVES